MKDISVYELSRTQWETLIDEWIFSERDRELIKRRLLDGVCIEPLAEEFYLSVRHTQTIIANCENILLKHVKTA